MTAPSDTDLKAAVERCRDAIADANKRGRYAAVDTLDAPTLSLVLSDHARLTTVCAALTAALREIGNGYYATKDAPKRLDECVDVARAALTKAGQP
jgi:hypothetical protein